MTNEYNRKVNQIEKKDDQVESRIQTSRLSKDFFDVLNETVEKYDATLEELKDR